jgi:hypothetical protein
MQIELRPPGDITPYEHNPRHNDDAVDAVAESIRRFGFRQPIVVDADGVIVAGHTRWKAAKQIGLEKVPVYFAKDLTPEQARAYRLADNKTGELATWDWSALQAEVEALGDDAGLEAFGFDPDARPGGDAGRVAKDGPLGAGLRENAQLSQGHAGFRSGGDPQDHRLGRGIVPQPATHLHHDRQQGIA